jgi:hypothetical protein
MLKTYKEFIKEIQIKREDQVSPEMELEEGFVTTASKMVALTQLNKAKSSVSKIESEKDLKKMMKHLGDAIVANSVLGTIVILNIQDLTKKNKKGRR